MATRLNQILAIRQGVQSEAAAKRDELLPLLANEGLLTGQTRTYRPKADPDDPSTTKYAGKSVKVQVTVPAVLEQLTASLTRLYDVELTQDMANTSATAPIVVTGPDGKDKVLAENVPTTYLLWLERQLGQLREFVSSLPVLDPAKDWRDKDAPPGQWRTDLIATDKTKKTPQNHVKFAGDQWHEPQIETFAADVLEGWWDDVFYSGAIPARTRQQYLDRIGALQRAVKFAREEANSKEIHDEKIAADLFRYIFS